ncbi:hypothetical protein [Xanthomonas translucens]|uniref:hypothetical protein n=1 Tax=Xanthomonas campestris pv. translucens TaxID=343 RepID=UPI0019D50430|nr:hypothetical protein [Xanthomonas translucens]QSQ38909.1 hypothetical protein ISN32_05475 [Xanthomonas translucens pv. translucens]
MTAATDYPRSIYEAKMDAYYYARLHVLHERLYSRLDKLGKLIELVSGSGAFYAVCMAYETLTQTFALIVAFIALASLVFDPAGRARVMRDGVRNYMEVVAMCSDEAVSLSAVDKRLAEIGVDAPTVIDGLRRPAYNQNLASHGRDGYMVALSRYERVLQAIA